MLGGPENVFRVTKPCARCAMINIDQHREDPSAQNLGRPNSAALADPRIFATLAKFRRRNGKSFLALGYGFDAVAELTASVAVFFPYFVCQLSPQHLQPLPFFTHSFLSLSVVLPHAGCHRCLPHKWQVKSISGSTSNFAGLHLRTRALCGCMLVLELK